MAPPRKLASSLRLLSSMSLSGKTRFEGQSVDSVWLAPATYPVESVLIGKTYDIDRDSRGFVVSFDLAY